MKLTLFSLLLSLFVLNVAGGYRGTVEAAAAPALSGCPTQTPPKNISISQDVVFHLPNDMKIRIVANGYVAFDY